MTDETLRVPPKDGPTSISFCREDGKELVRISERGIEVIRENFPDYCPDDFTREFLKILEYCYTVKFIKKMNISYISGRPFVESPDEPPDELDPAFKGMREMYAYQGYRGADLENKINEYANKRIALGLPFEIKIKGEKMENQCKK